MTQILREICSDITTVKKGFVAANVELSILGRSMFKLILVVAAAAFVTFPAHAQENGTRDWSGVWAGVGLGGAHTRYGGFSDGTEICFVSASSGASANCTIGMDSVTTEANAASSGGTASSRANASFGDADFADGTSTILPNPPTLSISTEAVSFSTPQSAFSSFNEPATGVDLQTISGSFPDAATGQVFALSSATASSPGGVAEAAAAGFINYFDFGSSITEETNFTLGGHIGADHQFDNNVVVGGLLDFTYIPNSGRSQYGADTVGVDQDFAEQSSTASLKALGTARIRLGLASGDFLAYATGGIGAGRFKAEIDKALITSILEIESLNSGSKTLVAPVVGGGISRMFGDTAAVSLEGLYYFFDDGISFSDSNVTVDSVLSIKGKISFKLK